MSIKLAQATLTQLADIMAILTKSIASLQTANSPQWSNNDGPTELEMTHAIQAGTLYTLTINDKIVGTTILSTEVEPAYANITYGNWQIDSADYTSIHRFAIDPAFSGKGYAKLFLNLLIVLARENGARDIRVDTHPLNHAMQRVIQANGFTFQGIVMLPIENGERYAYQRVIKNQ